MITRRSILSAISTGLLMVPVLLPCLVILVALLFGDRETWNHLLSTVLTQYILNTVLILIIVSIVTVILGVGTAWLTSIFRFPGSSWLPIALVLPLASPLYVVGYVYADLLEYSGALQIWLREQNWIESLPAIRSLPGAAFVMGFGLYPYVFLLTRASFLAQSSSLGEAARSLGANRIDAFRRITMPLAIPAVIAGLALVLMETVAEYGVVSHYGVPTFTTGIFRTWFAMGDAQAALQLAGCLLVIVVVLLLFEEFGRRGDYHNPVSRTRPLPLIVLIGWRGWMAFIACMIPVLIGFGVPVSLLVLHMFDGGDASGVSRLLTYTGNSLRIALIAAVFCAFASLVLSYVKRNDRRPYIRTGVRVATIGYALPGMMLAIGLLTPIGWLDRTLAKYILDNLDKNIGLLLTGSIAGLVLVYLARFMTVSFNSVNARLQQINRRYDDAARSMGVGNFVLFHRVHFPMLKPGLATGLVLVFIDVVKELPATLILRPFNFETLATRVYRLASDERLAEASTAALLIVVLALIPILMLVRQFR